MNDYRESRHMPTPAANSWHKPSPPPFSRRKPVDGTAKRVAELESSGMSRIDALKKLVRELKTPPPRRT
ncbi:MAG: hypothetical protein SFX18_10170 [Pirellulales bacterium]|nr:hypothetical protein [Pirellulales bacterium]